MKTVRAWILRLSGLFHKQHHEREMREELESHIALHVADNLRAGMTPEAAHRDALLKLGGLESLKEACRERSTAPFVEHLAQDTRFAFRQLRKNPAFTVTAMLVLALAISATVAIFTFVDAALIKPLPYPEPAKLVFVSEASPRFPRAYLSYLNYQDWKTTNKVFRSISISGSGGFLLQTAAGMEPVTGARVSPGFFRTLGVRPLLGRDFTPDESMPGGSHTALITYPAWKRRFGSSRNIVGKGVNLSGDSYTIIGVLPSGFQFAPRGTAEFWTTVDPQSFCAVRRDCHTLQAIARLKDGISVQQAQAEMTLISNQLEHQYPDANREQGAIVLPLADFIVEDLRPILLVLMCGATLVLAIACVNVASLVLVRSESRRREMALRSALGASTARLVAQFVTEAFLLVTGGTLVGLVLAQWITRGLAKLIHEDMLAYLPSLSQIALNGRVLACTAMLSIMAIAIISITPVLHFKSSKMRDAIAEGDRGSAGKGWRRLGSRLVVVELALAMVLLVGAGLCAKSLNRLMHVELGFHPDHLATVDVAAPYNKSFTEDKGRALGRDVIREVENIPGVRFVALTTISPVSRNDSTDWIRFVGRPYDGKHIEVLERDVSADYFRTIGATLLSGRYFSDSEDQSKPKVVIINRTLARKYFPGEDPIGKQIGDAKLTPGSIKTIIGVVKDIRDGALDSEIWPAEYRPFNQDPGNYFSLLARTKGNPESILPALRRAVRHTHPEVGLRDESTMERVIANSMSAYIHSASAWLVGGFAGMAFLLGIVGLYGVVAYSVSQRTREIGVRMALGAERVTVYRLILQDAGRLVVLGAGAGLVGSILAASSAHKLLFQVSSWDFETLVGVAILLITAALLASFVPARRATRISPIEALRKE